MKSGGDGQPTIDEMEEKKRIAEEEDKEKARQLGSQNVLNG